MSETGNYIKLSRKILKWEWYQNPVTRAVFIHLLLKATYKPTRWQGIELSAGQVITSRQRLADDLGYSVQQIRTALDHLSATNEITKSSTKTYTLINIVNWRVYQFFSVDSNQAVNQDSNQVPTKKITKSLTKLSTNGKTRQRQALQADSNQAINQDSNQQINHNTRNIYNRVSGTEVPDTDIIPAEVYNDVVKKAAENNMTPLEFWRQVEELRR